MLQIQDQIICDSLVPYLLRIAQSIWLNIFSAIR